MPLQIFAFRLSLIMSFAVGFGTLCEGQLTQKHHWTNPARPGVGTGRFLGLGYGNGYHWRTPGPNSDYYNPYSEHNSARVAQCQSGFQCNSGLHYAAPVRNDLDMYGSERYMVPQPIPSQPFLSLPEEQAPPMKPAIENRQESSDGNEQNDNSPIPAERLPTNSNDKRDVTPQPQPKPSEVDIFL